MSLKLDPCSAVSPVRLATADSGRELHAHWCNGHHEVKGAHWCPDCRIWWWLS